MLFFFFFCLPGRKARTFDLDAIFEQTRRTAIERSQHTLGKFMGCNDYVCGDNPFAIK